MKLKSFGQILTISMKFE